MIRNWLPVPAAAALLGCAACAAPSGPAPLLPADATGAFRLVADAGLARMETVDAGGAGFAKALRIEVAQKPARPAGVQVTAAVDAELKGGSVLLAAFWVRAAGGESQSGEAALEVSFQPGRSRFSLPLNMPVTAGKAWRKVQYPFGIRRNYARGEAQLVFTLGAQAQTVELGGFELSDYGASKRVIDLPATRLGYAGSEPGAAWRRAAEERIEKIRKGNLTVTVRDRNGKPVRNALVTVRMRKHAFGFGTAVSGPLLSGRGPGPENAQKYKEHILKLFNRAVMENDLKWPQWSVTANRRATLAAVDWLRENGIPVRGHCLVWPSWRWSNVKAAVDAKNDPAALAKVILSHVDEETRALEGRLVEWDVINEPYSNHDFMDILGRQSMVEWFKAARRADPNVKLFINDFEILAGENKAHQDHYYETIEYLLAQGAPVEGIGMQGHFPPRVTPPEEVLRRLDRFAAFKREISITEFDIDTNDELTQAEYTRDFLTAIFSHPSVANFLMWGFWEGSHWKPKASMLRTDWSVKPNGEAYKDTVFRKWWTNAEGRTGAQGTYTVRGFLGEYEVDVQAQGKTRTLKVGLPKGGAAAECVLE